MAKILCVDDDINILAGFQRNLRKEFEITNALGGPAALKILEEKGPFAVIVTDMRMPGMSGLEFLALAQEKSPDSVRVVLTGAADVGMAIEVTNTGKIFRFLLKPCPPELLAATLRAALDQYAVHTRQSALLTEELNSDARTELNNLSQQLAESKREAELVKQKGVAEAGSDVQVDTVTGLQSASDAEIAIRTAAAAPGGAQVVIFCLSRLHHTRTRFGNGVVDQMLHFAAQSLANRLSSPWASQGMFRWHGDAFVVIVQAPADLEEVRAEAKGLASYPLNYHFETRSRSAFVPVKIAATALAGTLDAKIFKELNEFAEAQKRDTVMI